MKIRPTDGRQWGAAWRGTAMRLCHCGGIGCPESGTNPVRPCRFRVVWRRDGAVVFVAQETVEMPGHYRQWTPPMLGSALAGQWTVEIIAGGHSLAHLRANVRATR